MLPLFFLDDPSRYIGIVSNKRYLVHFLIAFIFGAYSVSEFDILSALIDSMFCAFYFLGVRCFSACRIMLVIVVFSVCELMSIFSFLETASVSAINLMQFAFLNLVYVVCMVEFKSSDYWQIFCMVFQVVLL